MDATQKILYFIFDLVLPLAVGYACVYQHKVGKTFFDRMIIVNILAIYPILSVFSFWEIQIRMELIWLPFLGVILHIIPGVAAYLRIKKYSCSLDRGSYVLSGILSNILTLGGLAVYILYGEVGYVYTNLTVLFASIILFMFCYPLAQLFYQKHQQGDQQHISLRSILINRNQLPVLGVLAGLALHFANIERPAIIGRYFDPLVHLSAWTALVPIGYAMDFSRMRQYWRDMLDMIGIKFVITPVITYFIARMVITDPIIFNSMLVFASTPTAINAVIAVKLNNLNIHIAMAAFVVTTVVYIFVVYPLLFVLL